MMGYFPAGVGIRSGEELLNSKNLTQSTSQTGLEYRNGFSFRKFFHPHRYIYNHCLKHQNWVTLWIVESWSILEGRELRVRVSTKKASRHSVLLEKNNENHNPTTYREFRAPLEELTGQRNSRSRWWDFWAKRKERIRTEWTLSRDERSAPSQESQRGYMGEVSG